MGNVVIHPKADDPQALWPGAANINREGVSIAFKMLRELEDGEPDGDGVTASDLACLENWPRQGQAFRNIVAQYLAQAHAAGTETEAGFCAVLSDILSGSADGWNIHAGRYESMYNL